MDIKRIHFMREILVYDHRGPLIPTMQFSYDRAANRHPMFWLVPAAEQARVRVLYAQLGGVRTAGQWIGSTVILPGHSFWHLPWRRVI